MNDEMPQRICIYCSRKLKSSYKFIKQTIEVNEKLVSLVTPTANNYQKLDCLEESEIDIEKCLEIKLENVDDDLWEKTKIAMEIPCEQYNGEINKGIEESIPPSDCLIEEIKTQNKEDW